MPQPAATPISSNPDRLALGYQLKVHLLGISPQISRRVVQLHYQAISAEATIRLAEHFALLLSMQENWVPVGWYRLRHAYRIFRLARVQRLDKLAEMFPPHALTLPHYFASLRG